MPDADGQETIVALATAPQPAGVAVVRLSGPLAGPIALSLSGRDTLPHGQLCFGPLRDAGGALLDRGYVVHFAGPRSFTGEDVAELHLHGSLAVVDRVLDVCVAHGARLARPGEFSLRAFEHGKLDLTQAEALADLIAARTEVGREAALAHLDGALSRELEALRQPVLRLLAEVEARLDFSHEGEVGVLDRAHARALLVALQTRLDVLLAGARASRVRLRGARLALYGLPNAGKSTLFNALCGRQRALVDSRPGTTRDVLEAEAVLGGVLVTLVDTAGLRDTNDPVEAAGTRLATEEARQADLVLWLHDASTSEPPPPAPRSLPGAREAIVLAVRTKADLAAQPAAVAGFDPAALLVSAHTGQGMAALREAVDSALRGLAHSSGSEARALRSRHVAGLQTARQAADAALQALDTGLPLEFAAGDLREVATALGEVVGVLVPDDVLGAIFSQFCIGK